MWSTISNDGSRVTIDGNVVVDNWGQHGSRRREHIVNLDEGWHNVLVEHFNGDGSAQLIVNYRGDDTDDKEIAMDIPVHVIGKSLGVANGGSLRRNRRKLRVKALPVNLPDFIEADITPLKIGGKLTVAQLANDAFKFLHPDNTVVCQVKRSRVSIDVEEEEEEEGEEGAEAAAPAEGAAPADA